MDQDQATMSAVIVTLNFCVVIFDLLEQLGVGSGAQLILVSLSPQHGEGVGVGVTPGGHRG